MRLQFLLILLLTPGIAHAQYNVAEPSSPPTEAEISEARELYLQGGRLVREGRWADALGAFEASYRVSGIPAALFNAATTLRSMGRHRDARDLFAQLLAVDDLDDETREQSETRHREEAGRVALILVTGIGEATDARVELDGRSVDGPHDDPLELETDPGEHAVSVLRVGFAPWRQEVALGEGGRTVLRVSLDELDSQELWESPLLWTVLLVGLAGGGVVAGVLLQENAQLSPRPSFGGVVVEL